MSAAFALPPTGRGRDNFGIAIDSRRAQRRVQRDLIVAIPGEGIEIDFGRRLRAIQNIGKQNAIVVAVRLVSNDGDIVLSRAAALEDLLHRARAGHAVANDNEFLLFGHLRCSPVRKDGLLPRKPMRDKRS